MRCRQLKNPLAKPRHCDMLRELVGGTIERLTLVDESHPRAVRPRRAAKHIDMLMAPTTAIATSAFAS